MFDIKWHQGYLYTTANLPYSSGSYIIQFDTDLSNELMSYSISSNYDSPPPIVLFSLFIDGNDFYATESYSSNIFILDLNTSPWVQILQV